MNRESTGSPQRIESIQYQHNPTHSSLGKEKNACRETAARAGENELEISLGICSVSDGVVLTASKATPLGSGFGPTLGSKNGRTQFSPAQSPLARPRAFIEGISECRARPPKLRPWVPGVARRATPGVCAKLRATNALRWCPPHPNPGSPRPGWTVGRSTHFIYNQDAKEQFGRANGFGTRANIVDRLYNSIPRRGPPTAPLGRPEGDTNLTPPKLCNDFGENASDFRLSLGRFWQMDSRCSLECKAALPPCTSITA